MVDGNRLHAARRARRMTQAQLANAAGVSPRTVRRMESGLDASDESLRCVCAVLGLDCGSAGARPVPPGEAGPAGVAEAMACPDPRLYDVDPAPVRLPTLSEYVKGVALEMLREDMHVSVALLVLVFTMVGALATAVSLAAGEWGWACYFGLVANVSYLLCFLSGEGIERQGMAVYAGRSWMSVALAPMSAIACATMAATRPAFADAGIVYLLACTVFGAWIGAGGAYRLLGLRTDARRFA